MAKFRNKPRVIEATRLDLAGAHKRDLPKGVTCRVDSTFWVTTIHGQKTPVVNGDWIIDEPDGLHHYPCKPDIFEATYEAVETNQSKGDQS